uniref:Uncharacterized protein n=1 Tax=viral metagenome TaxID=1070528 RepID=A0A6C0BDR7_9ZZZZ
MNLPFSVLNSKREKPIRIQEEKFEIIESKDVSGEFERQLEDILTKGLEIVDYADVTFVKERMNNFYRNNIAVLLLTLNLRRNNSFIYTESYLKFVDYIKRGVIHEGKDSDFISKLNFQIQCYNEKIESILSS